MLLALVASVNVGFCVVFTPDAALAGEPGNEAAKAMVMTVASLGTTDIGILSGRAVSPESPCSSDQCRQLIQEPRAAHVPTSSTAIDEWKSDDSPVSHGRAHLARLTETEDRHLGLRILSPLYAIVALPNHPAWSPAAERPAVQRILVGFRLVVPF